MERKFYKKQVFTNILQDTQETVELPKNVICVLYHSRVSTERDEIQIQKVFIAIKSQGSVWNVLETNGEGQVKNIPGPNK